MAPDNTTRGGKLINSQKITDNNPIKRKLIVTIGIDAYTKHKQLHNAANDAQGIHDLFTQELGFEAVSQPLLNNQATKIKINTLIEEELQNIIKKDDALVIFFAGHGQSRQLQTRDLGYLVPVNAEVNHWGQYIRIKSFLESLDDLPALHIIVILDACHSGFALGEAINNTRGEIPVYASNLLREKSRHVLTSAQNNQLALDTGPIEHHSLFTGCLIDGLRSGQADSDNNGLVTTSDLGRYIQKVVGLESKGDQTPDFGRFASTTNRGEMVFLNRQTTPKIEEAIKPPVSVVPQVDQIKYVKELGVSLKDEDEDTREWAREELETLTQNKTNLPSAIRLATRYLKKHPKTDLIKPQVEAPKAKPEPIVIPKPTMPPKDVDKDIDKWIEQAQKELEDRDVPDWNEWVQKELEKQAQNKKTWGGLDWIEAPAGEFWMGNEDGENNEKPRHRLYLDQYWLSKTPVTNQQYLAFVQATGQVTPKHWKSGFFGMGEEKIPEGKENHPVVYVSWNDAHAYTCWLSELTGEDIRLPSEAEWEKGARGTDGRIYPWGNTFENALCNTAASGGGDTTPVNFYPKGASPYGAFDMAGNVWEWTSSSLLPYPYKPDEGREGLDTATRVLRGGSWGYAGSYLVRAVYRNSRYPYDRSNDGGFRLCRPRPPSLG